jgi:hypothetical protein
VGEGPSDADGGVVYGLRVAWYGKYGLIGRQVVGGLTGLRMETGGVRAK